MLGGADSGSPEQVSLVSAYTVQRHDPWDTIPGQPGLFMEKREVKEVGK